MIIFVKGKTNLVCQKVIFFTMKFVSFSLALIFIIDFSFHPVYFKGIARCGYTPTPSHKHFFILQKLYL